MEYWNNGIMGYLNAGMFARLGLVAGLPAVSLAGWNA